LFLRKQLAFFTERKVRPRRITTAARLTMIVLARFFDWRDALVIVKPKTFVKWHRSAFRMFWRWKSRKMGRPPLPTNLKELIREMARDNPTWGEERIADELSLKLGILVSPRTVRKYPQAERPGGGKSDQRRTTFVRNHAKSIVACDFLVSITATFQIFYVFVAMEIGSRRILHFNVTMHPTAEWTTQQFREILADRPASVQIRRSRSRFHFLVLARCGVEGFPCGRSEPRFERPRQMPSAKDLLGPFDASVWIISFHQ
jgi:putative transposase